MSVTPPSGTGAFNLDVGYRVNYGGLTAGMPETIVCSYVTPDGATMPIERMYPDTTYSMTATWQSGSKSVPFDVTRRDKTVVAGTYTASCSTDGGSSKTATFTVVAASVSDEPIAGPSPVGPTAPLVIKGSGTGYDYDTSTGDSCAAPYKVILVVKANGTAELSASGPHFVDHYNCTQDDPAFVITYDISGGASDGTIAFTSCNDNGFTASGVVRYTADGTMSGEAACIGKKGDSAGKTVFRLSIP